MTLRERLLSFSGFRKRLPSILLTLVFLALPMLSHAIFVPESPDCYTRLGVPSTANAAQLKKGFRAAMMLYHPDRGGTKAQAQNIQEAYAKLSDSAEVAGLARVTPRTMRALQDRFLTNLIADPRPSREARAEALREALESVKTPVSEGERRIFLQFNGFSELPPRPAPPARVEEAVPVEEPVRPEAARSPAPVDRSSPPALSRERDSRAQWVSEQYRRQGEPSVRTCGQSVNLTL